MAKIGDGVIASSGAAWPTGVDTAEVFQNGLNPAADSVTRIDAELVNDLSTYILHIAAILGDPRGGEATLQAKIADLEARVTALES
jgi:hypothetical protein